jgi:hypothetical protein
MSDILKTALGLREMGFAIHWLVPREKRPVELGWTDAPVMTIAQLEQSYTAGYNVGFRPGKWSVVNGKEVVVIDIDIRGGEAFAEEAYAVAKSVLDGAFDPQVKSGSGWGRHQYQLIPKGNSPACAATTLRESDIWILDGKVCSPNTKGARPAYVIELLSTGKNCVLPPSIHPDSGKPYEWLHKEIF